MHIETTMYSASGISGSACGSGHDGPQTFCVVCGNYKDDLILRRSGFKCTSCVGKSSNRHYVRLQKRQAHQLISKAFPMRGLTAGLDTASSVQSSDLYRAYILASSASSSLPPAIEGDSGSTGVSTAHSNTLRPIEDYISGTTVYRAAMERACYSGGNDCSTSEGGGSDQQTLISGAGGVTRSTSDTLSRAHNESNVPGSHTNTSASAAAGDNAGEMRRTPPPLVTQRQAGRRAPCSKSTSANNGSDGVSKAPRYRDPCRTPPTSTLDKSIEKRKPDGHTPSRSYKTAPSRLPPRNRPRVAKGAPRLPPSVVDLRKVPAVQKNMKSSWKATSTSSANGVTEFPPSSTKKMASGAVSCAEDRELMSKNRKGALRDVALPSNEPTTNQHHSHSSTPCGEGAASSAIFGQYFPHTPQVPSEEVQHSSRQSPVMPLDAYPGLPAPRAGSCNASIASSVTERGPTFRPLVSHSHAASSAGTHPQRDSQGGTRLSSRASSLAALPNGAARPADAHGAANTGVLSLIRMPSSSGATTDALDNCHGVGRTHRPRHKKPASRRASSSDSESSSSSESLNASATASSSHSAPSAVPPEVLVGEDDAAAIGAGTRKTPHGGTDALNAGAKKRTKKAANVVGSATKKGAGDSTGKGLATPLPTRHLGPLQITVESVLPPLISAPETTPSTPGRGDELPQATINCNDESSTTTGDSHSHCDSMRSNSSRTQDGYQRQVYVGGQSGKFKVTRHIRQQSAGSDVLAGRSGAATALSASARSTSTYRRHRQQQGSLGDTMSAGAVEVKKITYRLVVKSANSSEALTTQERRLYTHIIPALERVKVIAGGELPTVPVKRLPSLRFATEAFTEERRVEVEAFLQAVARSPCYIRHPDIVRLLGLDPYVADLCPDSATGAVAARGSGCNGTDAHRPRQSPSVMNIRSSPSTGGGSGMKEASRARAGASGDSKCSTRPSIEGGGDVLATAESDCGGAGTSFLTVDALNAYCSSAIEDGRSGTDDVGNFCRSQSRSSVQTTCSSVVRRRKLDEVTMEDLEHIQLGNLIGRGTFGSVYLGLVQTQRGLLMVAVKVMKVGEAVEPLEMESLQRELDVLCAARHKNIIRFLGSSLNTTTRELRVFTEYMECGTIRSLVDRFGALTMLAIQQYMHQILSGLQYLHSLSIAHRDIKGENILVTKNGRIKLSDFGSSTGAPCKVATAVAAAQSPSMGSSGGSADSGLPVGSPQYMAPEVIHGTARSFAAADIWSLGCVGIEMMDRPIWRESPNTNPFVFLYRVSRCGTPPHGLPAEDELAVLKAEGKKTEFEGFSVYLGFLRSCLRVDPAQRPSAAELLKHPFMTYPYSKHLRWMLPMPATAKPSALKSS